jgi:hypothetical protein
VPEPIPDWDLFGQLEPDFDLGPRIAWQPPSSATEDTAAPDLRLAHCTRNLLPNPAEARSDTSERSAALSVEP